MKTRKKGCPNLDRTEEEPGVEELEPRLAPFFDIFAGYVKGPNGAIAPK